MTALATETGLAWVPASAVPSPPQPALQQVLPPAPASLLTTAPGGGRKSLPTGEQAALGKLRHEPKVTKPASAVKLGREPESKSPRPVFQKQGGPALPPSLPLTTALPLCSASPTPSVPSIAALTGGPSA